MIVGHPSGQTLDSTLAGPAEAQGLVLQGGSGNMLLLAMCLKMLDFIKRSADLLRRSLLAS